MASESFGKTFRSKPTHSYAKIEFKLRKSIKMFKYLVVLALALVAVMAAPPGLGAAPKDLQTANQLLYGYGYPSAYSGYSAYSAYPSYGYSSGYGYGGYPSYYGGSYYG